MWKEEQKEATRDAQLNGSASTSEAGNNDQAAASDSNGGGAPASSSNGNGSGSTGTPPYSNSVVTLPSKPSPMAPGANKNTSASWSLRLRGDRFPKDTYANAANANTVPILPDWMSGPEGAKARAARSRLPDPEQELARRDYVRRKAQRPMKLLVSGNQRISLATIGTRQLKHECHTRGMSANGKHIDLVWRLIRDAGCEW
jgi:hypothetical protein